MRMLGRSDYCDAAVLFARCIDHTSEYVCHGNEVPTLRGSSRNREARLACMPGRLHGLTKGLYRRPATPLRPRAGRSDSMWPLTLLWPDSIIRGSCEFFPKTTYPSHAAIRNVAVSFAFISLRTTLRFCPSRSASAMASCQSL